MKDNGLDPTNESQDSQTNNFLGQFKRNLNSKI